MPSESEVASFYESNYYPLVQKGGRAPELRRLLAGGEEAERERAWLRATLYDDITTALRAHGSGSKVLDVGCGQGELLQWLDETGFEPHGIEPADDAAAIARGRGLDAQTATLEDLLAESDPPSTYDAVVLLNVLEHVPYAAETLRRVGRLLEPGGLLYIKVPNEFNPLQLAAQSKLGADPWWIAVPDHVNYFDIASLCALNRQLGFEPVDVQADFPMELFLLMGFNYVGDPKVGAICHAYRVEAEMSMPSDIRRDLFRSFAAGGIGRDARILARKMFGSDSDSGTGHLGASGAPGDHYRYVPLRRSDAEPLRQFRNDQIDVLRQSEPITAEQQKRWFNEVVVPAQRAAQPPMMLVSILDPEDRFIGYGGLTNLDCDARRAEVSFLVAPDRAADPDVYRQDMEAFLRFLSGWAFGELGLNRLFTETYAFRDAHIAILERAGFSSEGRLREHVTIGGKPTDSIVHGLLAADWRRA